MLIGMALLTSCAKESSSDVSVVVLPTIENYDRSFQQKLLVELGEIKEDPCYGPPYEDCSAMLKALLDYSDLREKLREE